MVRPLMCGIAGIVGRVGDANREALRRMTRAMSHRGPDGEGFWESAADQRGEGVLLGHRRLAILDLSPAGAQPMIDKAHGHAIVFNGEIYNFQKLRQELVAAGEGFDSTGDTQVILRMLATRGPDAVSAFRGMFALAAWDPQKRQLLLARDPLGIKPLYVARNPDPAGPWSVAFASEVRALLASGLLGTPRLAAAAVASVVWNGFVVGPDTAVRGVASLRPGELVLLDAAGAPLRAGRFWSIPSRPPPEPADEEQVAAELEESVRLHLVADVPLAVFLSSGVDSASVARLAQRGGSGPIHTFTLAFEDERLNEGHHARLIAAAMGTVHQEVLLTEAQVVAGIEAALDGIDQPTFDGLNSYFMSQAVRQAGFTVALVGTGGDELFGGYPTFRELPLLHRWSRRLGFVPRGALAAAGRVVAGALQPANGAIPPQTRWAKLPAMLRRADDLLAVYQLAYALFLPDFQESLLSEQGGPDGLPAVVAEQLRAETASRSAVSSIAVMEQRLFLGERLLRDNDAASMAVSIEQRLPLVDHVLFSAADRLPDAARFDPPGKKALLRRIGLRGLDPALFERPKAGFVLPFDTWIRKGLGQTLDDTLSDAAAVRAAGLRPEVVQKLWRAFQAQAPGLYWSRVWALFVLVRWCQRHGVRY